MTRLEFERRQRGWSQTTVAARAFLTQGVISLIERRRLIPTPLYAGRLADALGIPEHLLLTEVVDAATSTANESATEPAPAA